MSPLSVDLSGHASFEALKEAESMASKALRKWRTSGSESEVHRLSLVKDAVVFVRARLLQTDPAVISTSTLGEIGKHATQLRAQLEPIAGGSGSAQNISHH